MSSAPLVGRAIAPQIDERNFAWHLRGVVSVTAKGPVVRVRNHEYAMPLGLDYPAGAELRLKLVFEGDGWQLQILGPAGALAGPTPSAADRLCRLILQLGLPVAADRAARLVPTQLPRRAEAISTVIHRLAAAEGAGPALGRVVGPNGAPEHWRSKLRGATSLSPESILARLLLGDPPQGVADQVAHTPEQALAELADDAGLATFAETAGRGEEWQRSLSELAGRVEGERLLSLHALDSPYRFVELPLDPSSGWRRAQVHLLGARGGAGMVVLDAGTDRLGDLWLTLSVAGPGGQLRVQASRPQVRAAFDQLRPELEQAMVDSGYPDIEINVEPWNGDRLAAAVELFGTYRSVEVVA